MIFVKISQNFIKSPLKSTVYGMYETSIKNIEILHVANVSIILSTKRIAKVMARLRGCLGWSAPMLFACNKVRFSCVVGEML